jgi:hypothetical protein
MLLNGKPFSGSKRAIQLAQHLCEIVGYATWFSTFDFVTNPFPNETYSLLRELFEARLCFFLTGSFVYFMAGVFQNYTGASLFLALTDTPLTRLLFQLEGSELQTFWLGGFEFNLLEAEPEADLFIYNVTKGDFRLQVTIFGVDVSGPTGVLGSIDLIHFVLNNFETSYHKRYAITVIYPTLPKAPPLNYVTNIIGRVRMDGRITVDVPCAFPSFAMPQGNRPIASNPDACACNVCVLQPTKLFDMALRVYGKMVYHLEHLK